MLQIKQKNKKYKILKINILYLYFFFNKFVTSYYNKKKIYYLIKLILYQLEI